MNVNRHYFAQAYQTTASITSASCLVCNERKDRVYLYIANLTTHPATISLGTSTTYQAGFYLPKDGILELSSQKGNLYDGKIYGTSHNEQTVTIAIVEGYGI